MKTSKIRFVQAALAAGWLFVLFTNPLAGQEATPENWLSVQNCTICHAKNTSTRGVSAKCPAIQQSLTQPVPLVTYFNLDSKYISSEQPQSTKYQSNPFLNQNLVQYYSQLYHNEKSHAQRDQFWGMHIVPVDSDLQIHLGIQNGIGGVVRQVTKDSHAAKCGFLEHDIVYGIANKPIRFEELNSRLKEAKEKPLQVNIVRKGRQAGLAVMAPKDPVEANKYWIGTSVSPLDDVLRTHLGIEPNLGVVVTNVYDAPAQASGVAVNDILLLFDGKKIGSSDDLLKAVQQCGNKPTKVEFIRRGKRITIEVTPAERPAESASTAYSVEQQKILEQSLMAEWARQKDVVTNVRRFVPSITAKTDAKSNDPLTDDLAQLQSGMANLKQEMEKMERIIQKRREAQKLQPSAPQKTK